MIKLCIHKHHYRCRLQLAPASSTMSRCRAHTTQVQLCMFHSSRSASRINIVARSHTNSCYLKPHWQLQCLHCLYLAHHVCQTRSTPLQLYIFHKSCSSEATARPYSLPPTCAQCFHTTQTDLTCS
jgi:hypothetical protein